MSQEGEDFSDDDEEVAGLVNYPKAPTSSMHLHVVIIGTETVKDHNKDKKHVNYIIQVRHWKGAEWRVSRRFNRFMTLHEALKNIVDKNSIPAFPKKSIRRTFKESSINKKTLKLNRYLQGVSMIRGVDRIDDFCSFLVASFDDIFAKVKQEEAKSDSSLVSPEDALKQQIQKLNRDNQELEQRLRHEAMQNKALLDQQNEVSRELEHQHMIEKTKLSQEWEVKMAKLSSSLATASKQEEEKEELFSKQLAEIEMLKSHKRVLRNEVKSLRAKLGIVSSPPS